MNQQRPLKIKRRRPVRAKALFYAGIKGDGSPRGWTFADLAFVTICFAIVVFAVFFVLSWLWNSGFTSRK